MKSLLHFLHQWWAVFFDMGNEDKTELGRYISNVGSEIAVGIMIAAVLASFIRGCTDDYTVTNKYVNPPAVEQLQRDNLALVRQYDLLEQRVQELEKQVK